MGRLSQVLVRLGVLLASGAPAVAFAQGGGGMSGTPSAGVVEREAPPPAPAPVPVTPPSLTHFEHAEYPKEAEHAGIESNVVLLLDIDETGKVTQAQATPKVGNGFDEAAEAAAMKFVFDPARRGPRPIASRIRYLYKFTLAKAPPSQPKVHVPVKNLRGKVLAAGTNAIVAGASVTVRGPDGATSSTETGPDGIWGFDDLPPATYHLVAKANLFNGSSGGLGVRVNAKVNQMGIPRRQSIELVDLRPIVFFLDSKSCQEFVFEPPVGCSQIFVKDPEIESRACRAKEDTDPQGQERGRESHDPEAAQDL